jgi:glycosyltransferase involved in cell wall biosynthesis
MRKLVYIAAIEMNDADGVCKKIRSQINALVTLGFEVTFCYLSKGGYIVNISGQEKTYTLKSRYFFLKSLAERFHDKFFDVIYVRNPSRFHYPSFVQLAKSVQGKLLLELPTYPIETERNLIKRILSDVLFNISWRSLRRNIDKIYYMGEGGETVWGLPAKEISNGIEWHSIPINPEKSIENVNIIAVARMEDWHGYDRIIHSLAQLSNKDGVHLNIVGNNEPCLTELKNLTSKLSLSDFVTFHGSLHGEELSELFYQCSLAVDALGRHRAGHKYNSSIKSKEYTARGIPFIMSHIDKDFLDAEFVFGVPPNDSVFDLQKILSWLAERDFSPIDIRRFSQENLSWERKMEFVLSELE